jgi:hypothetical protein
VLAEIFERFNSQDTFNKRLLTCRSTTSSRNIRFLKRLAISLKILMPILKKEISHNHFSEIYQNFGLGNVHFTCVWGDQNTMRNQFG